MINSIFGYLMLLISVLYSTTNLSHEGIPDISSVDTIQSVTYLDKQIMIDGENDGKHNNKLFYQCNFNNGVILGGVQNITFKDCKFKNKGVILGGRNKDIGRQYGTNNVTFINCTFDSVTENAIVTRRNNYDHFNLVIRNCKFSSWGIHDSEPCFELCDDPNCNPRDCTKRCNCKEACERCSDPYNKFDHAIYMRATNYLIEGNIFLHTTGGAAISCRTAGKVINNRVIGAYSGVGIGMEYWPHKKWGNGGMLQIEGNQFIESIQSQELLKKDVLCECSNAGRAVMLIKSTQNEKTVDSLIIRYNTIILENTESVNNKFKPAQISPDYEDRFNIIYGNLVADFTRFSPTETDMMSSSLNFHTSNKSDLILHSVPDSLGTLSKEYLVYPKSPANRFLSKKKLLRFAHLTPIYIVQDKLSAGNHYIRD